MSDREAFRQSIEEYLKRERKNWDLFAHELGYTREHVSRVLHGNAKMPEGFERRAVLALVKLGCIRGKGQARSLLQLMELDFPLADWNESPLAKLSNTVSSKLTVGAETSIPEQETVRDIRQSSSLSLWTVPYPRNPFFTGRDELLDQIHQQLTKEEQNSTTTTRRVALTQPQTIKGLGGIGKTQIAIEYAYRSRDLDRYTHTLWFNAASEETIITSFVTAEELLASSSAKNGTNQQTLVEWLEQCEQSWLLIFDNANNLPIIQGYLPQKGNGNVLLTTRTNTVGSLAIPIEMEKMGRTEGTQFLLRRAQRFDDASDEEMNEATHVVIALDHSPLALDQAGAYINETKCGFVDYLQLYQTHSKKLLAQRDHQSSDYPHAVATTWSLSFQKVKQTSPAGAELLCLCAFLAPDTIPEELISGGAFYWSPPLQQAATDPFIFNKIITELLKFSLVKRHHEDKTLSIHRLVQAVIKDTMKQNVQVQWAKSAIQAVNALFPSNADDVTMWSQCLRYLSQTQACSLMIEQYALMLTEAVHLLNRTVVYLWNQALYSIAEPLSQCALKTSQQMSGLEHSDTATCLYNLARLYQAQGMYEQTEPLLQQALAVREQVLGPTHLDTTTILNELAVLYANQGKYQQAEPLFQHILAIHEQTAGLTPQWTATSLNNLALLYHYQNKYQEAEPLFQRALAIREQILESTHPDIANSLNNLAMLYENQSRYQETEPLYLRALAIFEQAFGVSHPYTAQCLNNLGALYFRQGKHQKAESHFQRALIVREQVLGPLHTQTAQSLLWLAMLFEARGEVQRAEPLYQRAFTIREKALGLQHPHTQVVIQNYTSFLRKQKCEQEAHDLEARMKNSFEPS